MTTGARMCETTRREVAHEKELAVRLDKEESIAMVQMHQKLFGFSQRCACLQHPSGHTTTGTKANPSTYEPHEGKHDKHVTKSGNPISNRRQHDVANTGAQSKS